MKKRFIIVFLLIVLNAGMASSHGEHPKNVGEETDPKAFKILKKESIDPLTGLPRTQDPIFLKEKRNWLIRLPEKSRKFWLKCLVFVHARPSDMKTFWIVLLTSTGRVEGFAKMRSS